MRPLVPTIAEVRVDGIRPRKPNADWPGESRFSDFGYQYRPHVRFRPGETGKGSKARALPWTRQGHSPWNQSVGVCSIRSELPSP
jgi:hypothetical protein